MTNIVNLSDYRPKPVDPWQHNQPSLKTTFTPSGEEREELWSHPYYGVSQLIWATGSYDYPEPPTPSGGSPVANAGGGYTRLKVAA